MKYLKFGAIAFTFSFLVLSLVPAIPASAAPIETPSAASSATLAKYKGWIAEARDMYPYPESVNKMYRVMMCESGGDPTAVGGRGRWHGLFQYVPGTWRASWNPYRDSSIYDAKAQIFATAKAWARGMQNHWSCYKLTS